MTEMYRYPSIDQFRNVIRAVQNRARWTGTDENGDAIFDRNKTLPKLNFRGTTKAHGSNGSFVYDVKTASFQYQSRERVLTLEADNAGFMLYMMNVERVLSDIVNQIFSTVIANHAGKELPEKIAVYGEWCGGNIQKGVAITGLPKMFLIFGVKYITGETSSWIDNALIDKIESADNNIYNIARFGTWSMDIDFERPELAQNVMVDITVAVENECPIGKYFGVLGVGEGVVWKCTEAGWESSDYMMKVKGEKHSTSKVKTIASVDVEAIESLNAFVSSVVTEQRLEQGLDNLVREQLLPFEMASMGQFIRLVFADVMKEETDVIVANQFNPKKLGGPIANVARKWYIDKLNSTE